MKFRAIPLVMCAVVACGQSTSSQAPVPTTKPVLPLPAHMLGGAKIPIFPLVSLVVQPGTGWDAALADRAATLRRVDSIVAKVVREHAPEIEWIAQDAVRAAADKAPGMLQDPDLLATRSLKRHALATVPEPLRAQLRQLAAVSAGGRYALVPAELIFVHDSAKGQSYADFSLTLVDVRLGAISWSNTLRGLSGMGGSPWDAVAVAVRIMFP